MAVDTVKVTLTADDQATEIVRRLASAVKQLDQQQKTAAGNTKAHGDAAKGAASAFGSFRDAIVGVAAALGALRVVEFVRNTIEATDQLGKLAIKTGATTESLSVLAVAASHAQISQEDLGNGLKFLSRAVAQLQEGIPATVEAFAALGLSAKDLKGLSLDQVLVKVANAQANFSDGAGKAAVALKLFGRNGTELLPLLHDLASGGFNEATKKAQELGVVVGTEAFEASKRFDESLSDLKNSLKGVVIAAAPFIKTVADMVKTIADFVAHHQGIVLVAGALVLVAGALGAVATAAAVLGSAAVVGALAFLFTPAGAAVAAFLAIATAIGAIVTQLKSAADARRALEAPLDTDPALNKALGLDKPKPDVSLTDPAQRKALIEAQLAATKQGLKEELEATQTGIAKRQEIETASFAQGLTSLQTFYARKIALTKQGVAAQITELEAEKTALSAAPLPENTPAEQVKRATELKAIQAQIDKLNVDSETQVLTLLEQQRVAALALQAEMASFLSQIQRATGDVIGAEQTDIERAARKYEERLRQIQGLSDDFINEQRNAFSTLLTDRAAFAEKQRQGERALVDLGLERDAIQLKANQGLISEHGATLQIADLEQSRLPALQEAADLMAAFAAETKDPALIQAAQQFRASFAGIGVVVQESTKLLANLGQSVRDAGKNAISGFLTTGVNSFLAKDTSQLDALRGQLASAQKEMATLLSLPPEAGAGDRITQLRSEIATLQASVQNAKDSLPSLGNAVRESLLSAFQAIQRAIADILAAKLVEKLSGLFDGAQSSNAGALLAAGVTVGVAGASVQSGAQELAAAGVTVIGAAAAITAAAIALAAAGRRAGGGAGDGNPFLGILGTALDVGSLFGFASGGPVRGAGSGTSDSILARLSHGEYVIPAAVVRMLGVPFFDMIRGLNGLKMPSLVRPRVAGLPAFATGGFVSGGSSTATLDGGIDATFGLEDGLVLKHLNTRGGLKGLLRIVEAHPQAFKAALGVG